MPFLRRARMPKYSGTPSPYTHTACVSSREANMNQYAAYALPPRISTRGMTKAFTSTGKMPPTMSLSGVFLMNRPATHVSAAATSEHRLPSPMSYTLPVMMFAIRQPTYSAGMASG